MGTHGVTWGAPNYKNNKRQQPSWACYMPPWGMHPIATNLWDQNHSYQPYLPNDWNESYPSNSNQDVCIGNYERVGPFYPPPSGRRYKEQYYPIGHRGYDSFHSRRQYSPPCSRVYSLRSREFLPRLAIMEDEKALPIGLMLEKGIIGLSVVELKKLHNNVICRQNKTLAKQKEK